MTDQGLGAPAERITIRHVALDAGVSVAAVSKVMRNAYGVSDQLRQKVEASIEKLNYRPSMAARGMRGRTYTIGILVIELTNPFLPGVIESVIGQLAENGYKALVGVGHSVDQIEASMIEAMIDNRMDGVIVIAPRISGKFLETFAKQIPIVAVAHHEQQSTTYDTVNSDDRAGAKRAVQMLLERGYGDVAMIGYDFRSAEATEVALQRELGYMDAMKAAGLERQARILRLPQPGEDRSEAITKLLKAADRPRAMFVWSDLDAIPLLSICQDLGIRVPEDLAVIGYDNSPPAAIPLIGLSSVDQNPVEMGRIAADLLLSRMTGRRKTQHILIEPDVIARKTI
ncbi:LacI family DNA-binding transcriptional regulator [Rhizobium sp. C4]|uniref:LacI family DNA-binding transcriptional regulator n=1 Tax=Rhizobium sp. C4 TaxID=1349800 RepID=UPI001E46C60A|nr:LacI family DNA-binding transcriptional regulator [Rhizobium sp. C4]MCD2175792.1 LacI family transcriptional regulator [Rhizobium sp. C4]